MSVRQIVLGTRNRHKVREISDLFVGLPLELISLDDCPAAVEVIEDGETFGANARKKAVEQALALRQWVLAEDSGLEVDALGGAPGVYSARYSDPGATDERNNDKLLAELAGVPTDQRTAHYVCYAVLADERGNLLAEAEGRCHGRIVDERRGTGGFGYDPLFEIVEYHCTFGELGDAVKAALSHRARAMRALWWQLRFLLSNRST